MSRFLAIDCTETPARMVIVRSRPTGSAVETVLSVPLAEASEPSQTGQQIAEALAPYRKGLRRSVMCIGRDRLQWQQFTLPPAPADEMPDLIRFQAERDMVLGDDFHGLDFLPLSGDEQSPHQVLAMAAAPSVLGTLEPLGEAAEVKIERLVPQPAAWVAVVRRAIAMQKTVPPPGADTTLFAAAEGSETTIWAMTDGRIVLLRTLRIAGGGDPVAVGQSLQSELHRTMLALDQMPEAKPATAVWLAGDLAQASLAESLGQAMQLPFHLVDGAPLFASTRFPDEEGQPTAKDLMLAGLALDEAENLQPLVDLLNPRHRTAPRLRRQTLVLAAVAVASLLLLGAWLGYQNIIRPRQAAAIANDQLSELEQTIADYQPDLQKAAAIRRWNTESVSLLEQLERLSVDLREKPLDAEDFPQDNDLLLQELDLQGQQFYLEAIARNRGALQQIEARLRGDNYQVERDTPKKKETPAGYSLPFRVNVLPLSRPQSSENDSSAGEGGVEP